MGQFFSAVLSDTCSFDFFLSRKMSLRVFASVSSPKVSYSTFREFMLLKVLLLELLTLTPFLVSSWFLHIWRRMPAAQWCEGKVGVILWNVKHFSLRLWRTSIFWKHRAIFGRREGRWNSQGWHSFTFQKMEHVCVGGLLSYINHILPLLFADWCMNYRNKIISNLKSKNLFFFLGIYLPQDT